jgi:hypothetical protein
MSSPCTCCSALWIKFTLTTQLTQALPTARALIFSDSGVRQYWQGDDPYPNLAEFDVYNLEVHQPAGASPVFQFFGDIGDVGLACLDDSDPNCLRYRIVQIGKASVLLGHVTTAIPPQGTGNGVCELFDCLGNDLHTSVQVYNLYDYTYGVGVSTTLFFDDKQGKWYANNRQEVFFGIVSGTSIAGPTTPGGMGSTGDIKVYDSQYNLIGTWHNVRALAGLVRAQEVQVSFDFQNSEFVAWPINQPAIAVATADTSKGASGNINIKTSKQNDPQATGTPSTAWATFADIKNGDYGLTWWDFYEQQRFFFPLAAAHSIRLGKFTGSTWNINTTSTVEIYTDHSTDAGYSISGVTNPFFPVIIAGFVLIVNDGNNWIVAQVQNVQETLVTGWRYNTGTHTFQNKTISANVAPAGTESDWTDITDGSQPVATDIVVDVTYDTGTHLLQEMKSSSAYVLEAPATATTTVDTAESC